MTKSLRGPSRSLLALPLLVLLSLTDAHAIMSFGHKHEIELKKSDSPSATKYSNGWKQAASGLRAFTGKKMLKQPLWIKTGKIPLKSKYGPHSVRVEASVSGDIPTDWPFPRSGFVRYSTDGIVWSGWQALIDLDERTALKEGAPRRFSGLVAAPHTERERYLEYRSEWQRSKPKDSDDEHELVRWIKARDPRFFEHRLPFVGFVEFRFEGPGYAPKEITVKEILVRYDFSVGGFRKLFR